MHVIDVDSHYEPSIATPDDHPLRTFLDRLPDPTELAVQMAAGDLLDATRASDRLELRSQIAQVHRAGAEGDAGMQMARADKAPLAAADAAARVSWMDSVGIDFGLVNPGGSYGTGTLFTDRFLPDPADRHRALSLCNDYLAGWLAGHTDRLSPVTLIDINDLTWTEAEMRRMRDKGSRAVFLYASAFEGRAPGHPANDRFWRTMSSLGMLGILHIGATPARFEGGWADAGWNEPGGTGVGGYLRYANSARLEAAEKFIGSLVFGGTFARVPAATVVLEELWSAWIPWLLSRFQILSGGGLGSFECDLSPHEYLRRNVKVTPLPGLGDDGMAAAAVAPEMLVFASDFPHGEGNADPINALADPLLALPNFRNDFLGGTIAECFARTGDPLSLSN
jgi:predicted TIM-barrel fold metal-dependent hydrolase